MVQVASLRIRLIEYKEGGAAAEDPGSAAEALVEILEPFLEAAGQKLK